MNFTTWSNLTAVGNYLVEKGIFGLVVNHTVFAHIRPQNVWFILLSAFKWISPPGRIPSGWKDNIWLSGKSYWVRPYPTIKEGPFPIAFTYVHFFQLVSPADWIFDRSRNPSHLKDKGKFRKNPYWVCLYPTTRGQNRGIYMYFIWILSDPDYLRHFGV